MLPILRSGLCILGCVAGAAAETIPWAGQDLEADHLAAAPAAGRPQREISLYPRGVPHLPRHQRILTRQVALQVRDGADGDRILARHGLRRLAVDPDAGFILATADRDDPLAASLAASALGADPEVLWASPILRRPITLKATPDDPGFASQWHLQNDGTVAAGAVAGIDLNVLTAWDTVRGTGITIAVIDEGTDIDHADLAPAVVATLQRDLVSGTSDPRPRTADENHGTVVSGLATARGFNALGVCGAAPAAGLAPIRLIVGSPTDASMATAFTTGLSGAALVSVSSSSWGSSDAGDVFEPVSPTLTAAFVSGATTGRGGRGVIYVFAAGNGYQNYDDAAYDGFLQQRQVMAVGAVDAGGAPAFYTEEGASLLLCAPGGDSGAGAVEATMASTDRGGGLGYVTGDYTAPDDALNAGRQTSSYAPTIGTSFAAPLVSGVAALVLEANPALTWRDVQHILVGSAWQVDPADPDWQSNGSGLPFHHRLGYGLVDATAAVTATTGWIPVPAETSLLVTGTGTGAIPDGGTRSLAFNAAAAGALRVEAAVLTITVSHARWSDLTVTLQSPAGTQARIAQRTLDAGSGSRTLRVVCRPFWNEAAAGTWNLDIHDLVAGSTGSVSSAKLTLYGWLPRPAPAASTADPALVRAGDASATITISGSGFATDAAGLSPVTTVAWNLGAASGTANVISATSTSLQLTLPGAALAGTPGDLLSLTCTNPAFAGLGGGSAAAIAIALRNNLPPTLGPASVTARTGRTASVNLGASDPDGDALTWSATAATLGTVSFAAGELVFAAGTTLGSETVTVTADDGHGAQTLALVTLTVVAIPPASDGSSGGCGAGLLGVFVILLGTLRRRR